MWEPDEQEYAVAFLVLSSVGGSVVGAIVGAFVQAYKSLPWLFWTQLLVGGGVQLVHLLCNPETRATVLLDREAKRRRKNGETNVYGPNEVRKITAKVGAPCRHLMGRILNPENRKYGLSGIVHSTCMFKHPPADRADH